MLSDNLEPGVREQVADLLRAKMVKNALHHRGEEPYRSIDPFSAAILESRGLLMVTDEASPSDDMRAVLEGADVQSRTPAPPGPYVFLRDGDRGSVIDPAELLADQVADRRLAALGYLAGLPDGVLARRSRRLIEEARPRISSDDRTEWFSAAKGVYDLLRADIYLTLAGFRQCYKVGYLQGVNEFLPKLLRPDSALLSSIDLDCWNPSAEYELAENVVSRLTSARSLDEALGDYYRQFGHLPLCGSLSLGRVVRSWAEDYPGEDFWNTVWGWADECQSPVARYHACTAFLANPGLVPSGAEDFLWGEVGDAINAYPEGAARSRWVEAWAVRDDLALHFGNYLECLLPELPGERLMVTAWWMAERICEALPPSPGLLMKIRETTFAGELERSGFMNHLTHPPVGPSSLRYMTRLVRRVWSASALCELGEARWLFDRGLPPPDVGRGLDESLVELFVLGYPRAVTSAPRPVYGFERSLGPAATAWTKATEQQEGERVDLTEALRLADESSSLAALPGLVARLADESPEDDLRAAHFLRQMAHFDPAVGETLWRLFNENECWRAVLANTGRDALGVLFEALTELQVQREGEWRTSLAHMCATAADKAEDDERRHLLVGITLFASIHAGSVSAIDRLMHGPQRAGFAKFAARWRDRILPALRHFTPWAAGRARAVLPSLTLDELDDFT
jgi:hypothetical protein